MPRSKLVAVRLPDELIRRLDEYALRMSRTRGIRLTRSQQIKSLVELGLRAEAEVDAPATRKK